ncbi:MAG: TMEM165/GDT1 family protein [Deltaproteobacteria bacterium]|nr:TMEM165/GDT1 family protein [Deltaproteobacteria bacterium]
MNLKMLFVVFFTIFLAELGDKTQMATLLLASNRGMNKVGLFLAASSALVLATLMAVVIGSQVSRWVSPQAIRIIAGLAFIAIGLWILWGMRA